jgi:hypothetical protein
LVPVLTLLASLLPIGSAQAADRCAGHVTRSRDITWTFFIGHTIQNTYTMCITRKTGRKKPRVDAIYLVKTPRIEFPSRFPTGGGEGLRVKTKPYLYSHHRKAWVYRYSVEQSVLHTSLKTTYVFELSVVANGNAKSAY